VIIVSNTTPLSELAKVGKLELLRELFGTIFISQEVYDEVIQVNTLRLRQCLLLTRNLPVTGTIGLLLVAKNKGILVEIKPILEEFLIKGKRISPYLYQEVLEMAGEN
jgi:predicted nucleic acid-binding protein